jgi:hypothetical protein
VKTRPLSISWPHLMRGRVLKSLTLIEGLGCLVRLPSSADHKEDGASRGSLPLQSEPTEQFANHGQSQTPFFLYMSYPGCLEET